MDELDIVMSVHDVVTRMDCDPCIYAMYIVLVNTAIRHVYKLYTM